MGATGEAKGIKEKGEALFPPNKGLLKSKMLLAEGWAVLYYRLFLLSLTISSICLKIGVFAVAVNSNIRASAVVIVEPSLAILSRAIWQSSPL